MINIHCYYEGKGVVAGEPIYVVCQLIRNKDGNLFWYNLDMFDRELPDDKEKMIQYYPNCFPLQKLAARDPVPTYIYSRPYEDGDLLL